MAFGDDDDDDVNDQQKPSLTPGSHVEKLFPQHVISPFSPVFAPSLEGQSDLMISIFRKNDWKDARSALLFFTWDCPAEFDSLLY